MFCVIRQGSPQTFLPITTVLINKKWTNKIASEKDGHYKRYVGIYLYLGCWALVERFSFSQYWVNSNANFRETFDMMEREHENQVEMTKTSILEGTSKWSAKIAIRGLFLS